MRNPLTEGALTGVKGTAGNATGTSGCRQREGVPVAGWEPGTWWRQIGPSLLSSRGVATGRRLGRGRRFPGRKQFIWGTRSSWRGRPTRFACFQGQTGREEGLARAKAASRAAFWPRPWLHQPLTFPEKS